MDKEKLENKSIAMIIAFKEFRDEEYFIPKQIFENQGIKVKTFSNSLGNALGKMGGEAKVDCLISDLDPGDFSAIVFIGGPGALDYTGNTEIKRIIEGAKNKDKLIAGICIAPLILAEAGVLNGKKATIWSSEIDKSAVKQIKEYGALYEKSDVVVDGKIITASGPEAAENFSKEIIKNL